MSHPDDTRVQPLGAPRAGPSSEISSTEQAEQTAQADGAAATAEVGAAGVVDGASSTQEVAAALDAGRIDAEQARAALIEQAIAEQLGPGADPALVAELRADLQAALADDPTIAALLRS